MSCRRYEKWISDELDGMLVEKKKSALDRHLAECPDCGSYRERLARLQEGTGRLPQPGLTPDYWSDFSFRLEQKIRSAEPRPARPQPAFWKWAWTAAGAVLLFSLGLAFWLSRQSAAQGNYIFCFEDSIDNISEEIGDDADLEEVFNSLLLSSIEEHGGGPAYHFSDDPLIWESLSEEEIRILETSLKKDTKS